MTDAKTKLAMTAREVSPVAFQKQGDLPSQSCVRKDEHISFVMKGFGQQSSVSTGFDAVRFEHCALPENDFDQIQTDTQFLGKPIGAPILVSAMTGGADEAGMINLNIARACAALELPMSVGSQRIALEGDSQIGFSKALRKTMGDLPILSNLGAVQLNYGMSKDAVLRAVEMIEADALVFHLNPLQEVIQTGGNRNFSNLLAKLEAVVNASPVPIGAKEVGAGVSAKLGQRLSEIGIEIIDVAGVGGTSWARVEAERGDDRMKRVAEPFYDWGIPSAKALFEMANVLPEQKTLIASGGIRHGLDVARSIRLGAHLAGQAAGALPFARESDEALTTHLSELIEQLKIAMFCTGSQDLDALRVAPLQSATIFES